MRTSPRALAALSGGVAASLFAATLLPASAIALPQSPQLASQVSVLTDDGDTSLGTDAASNESGQAGASSQSDVQSASEAEASRAQEDSPSAEATTPSPADASDAQSEDESIAEEVAAVAAALPHGVPVPNPLDFDGIPADPDGFLIPQAAERFKNSSGTYTIGRPTSGGPNAGNVVPGLEDFYSQKIEWGPCGPFSPQGSVYDVAGLECGYVIVPMDYAKPNGPTIAIGLLKVPAAKPDEKIGTIFVDPGGPGGSGMEVALSFLHEGAGPVRERFDYVGFDPRGVSSSLPMIRCKSSAAFDAQRQGFDTLNADQRNAVLKHNTEQCYKNTAKGFEGIDSVDFIGNVGTGNVVRDLDIARASVGDPKINYLGFSYGTSIGYQYAMAFPDNIRAMVIDGVVNPFENNPEEAKKYEKYTANTSSGLSSELAQLQGFQSTFIQFLKTCAANNGFRVRGVDVACAVGTSDNVDELMANYKAISQKAWGGTTYATTGPNPRPLSFRDLNQGTILAMYAERLWPFLNLGLQELKQRNIGDTMMLLSDAYSKRDSEGKYTFDDAAFQTIWCTDSGTPEGANETAAARKRLEDQYALAPFTDPGKNPDGTQRGIEPEYDWCTYYKAQRTLPKGVSLEALPNILVVSTTYDPSTPYQDGVVAADALNGTLLTVAANDHTSYTAGAGNCAADIGDRYFVDLIVPTDIPGNKKVSTKNLLSEVITGDECQVHSFRPEVVVAPVSAAQGATVDVTVTGLVRNTEYVLTAPEGFTVKGAARSDVNGVAIFSVMVPATATLGAAEVSVAPTNPVENDPLTKGTGVLTVIGPSVQPDASPAPQTPPTTGDSDGKNAPSQAGAEKAKSAEKKLASTGTPMGVIFALVAGAAVGGLLFFVVATRASRRSTVMNE